VLGQHVLIAILRRTALCALTLCALMLRGGGLATRHVLRGREAHACQQHSGTD